MHVKHSVSIALLLMLYITASATAAGVLPSQSNSETISCECTPLAIGTLTELFNNYFETEQTEIVYLHVGETTLLKDTAPFSELSTSYSDIQLTTDSGEVLPTVYHGYRMNSQHHSYYISRTQPRHTVWEMYFGLPTKPCSTVTLSSECKVLGPNQTLGTITLKSDGTCEVDLSKESLYLEDKANVMCENTEDGDYVNLTISLPTDWASNVAELCMIYETDGNAPSITPTGEENSVLQFDVYLRVPSEDIDESRFFITGKQVVQFLEIEVPNIPFEYIPSK